MARNPELTEILLDFFTWCNDPSIFNWHERSLDWQTHMRSLSFMRWAIEMQSPKAAWGTGKK